MPDTSDFAFHFCLMLRIALIGRTDHEILKKIKCLFFVQLALGVPQVSRYRISEIVTSSELPTWIELQHNKVVYSFCAQMQIGLLSNVACSIIAVSIIKCTNTACTCFSYVVM